jgi:DNA-binding MarR family transcriptional regulator
MRYTTTGTRMVEDIVKELGYLTLGSRLKRIGERLQAQAEELLEDAGTPLSASHCPVLAALDRLGPLNVGELSQALGISQPGVTRLLEKLQVAGLLRSQPAAADRRVRQILLTRSGRQFVARAKQAAWARIEAAVADACHSLRGPLLVQLTDLEDALADAPLNTRSVRRRSGERGHASA